MEELNPLSSRPLHPLSRHPPHLVHPRSVKGVIDLAFQLGEEEEELDEDVIEPLTVQLEDEVVDVDEDVGEHVQLTLKAQHRRKMMIGSGIEDLLKCVRYLELFRQSTTTFYG